MSDEQQPRAEWIFPEEKRSNAGRIWLIVGLTVAALVIVGIVLFFLIPRDATPAPGASSTPSPTSTSASPSPSPSETADPEPTPITTPPPAPNPDLATFTAQVEPRLDDGVRGLDLVEGNLDVGAQIVDSLQQDAAILSGAAAPSAIADEWSSAVAAHTSKLDELRTALDNGSDPQSPLNASRTALNELRAVVGL